MEKSSTSSEGISNASYVGTLHYALPPCSTSAAVVTSSEPVQEEGDHSTASNEHLNVQCNELITTNNKQHRFLQRKGIRSSSDPVKSNISIFLDKLKIDTSGSKRFNELAAESSPGTLATSPCSPRADHQHETGGGGITAKSYVKPKLKSCESDIKFSSKGLPSQSSNFTPLMYRRAISLRGHSSKRSKEYMAMTTTAATTATTTVLRRTNSEKGSKKKGNSNLMRSSSTCGQSRVSSHNRGKRNADEAPSSNLLVPGERHLCHEFDYRILENNSGSCESFDMTDLVKRNASSTDIDYYFSSTASLIANDLSFLTKDMDNYLSDLKVVLHLYRIMKNASPEKIRLGFDLPLNEIKAMHELQIHLNDAVRAADGNLMKIAKLFQNEKFVVYQQFTILCPSILKNSHQYRDHLEANYPSFKEKILRPSNRLNFYVQILNNLMKFGNGGEKAEIRRAINHLEELKMNANTEMTIQIIRDCPVDLHLAGKMLHIGELTYVSGPLQKRPYCLLAFENMLLVTISKVSYFIYVSHYRIEQLVSVGGAKELGLTISTSPNNQGPLEIHKFKTSSYKVLEKWYFMIEELMSESTASFEIVIDSSSSDLSPTEGLLFPLSLWQVFPFLWRIYNHANRTNSAGGGSMSREGQIATLDNIEEDCKSSAKKSIYVLASELLKKEEDYVHNLNSVFNPETLPPPTELIETLRRFLNLHEVYFLQELREATKKNCRLVIDIFMNYIQKFSTYKHYIFKRSLCTTQLPDGIRAQHYILPIQQFAFYMKWAFELGKHEAYSESSAFAVDTLRNYIYDAKVMLLHEAIPKCYLDFYRTGELKRSGPIELKVKPRQKNVRDGSYLVVLFEKVILITKPNPPTYKLILDLWLNQINFGPPSECSNAFKIEFRQGRNKLPITYEFKASSTLSKCGWVEALADELQKIAQQIRRQSNSKYSSN